MTPKEKAREIFEKFLPYVDGLSAKVAIPNAKHCAFIAVYEVIGAICKHDSTAVWNYWQQVKTEIQNL